MCDMIYGILVYNLTVNTYRSGLTPLLSPNYGISLQKQPFPQLLRLRFGTKKTRLHCVDVIRRALHRAKRLHGTPFLVAAQQRSRPQVGR